MMLDEMHARTTADLTFEYLLNRTAASEFRRCCIRCEIQHRLREEGKGEQTFIPTPSFAWRFPALFGQGEPF